VGVAGRDGTNRVFDAYRCILSIRRNDRDLIFLSSLSYSVLARDGSFVLPFSHRPANKIWLEAAAAFRFGLTNEGAET
jgi:hypothetical protein